MARNYTVVPTSIRALDSPFRGLRWDEQNCYFLLSTQPNISAAGTLPITLRRWVQMASDLDVDVLRRALKGLVRAGWVVMDEDTDELLVVPFVRDDKGYGNSKRRGSIVDAAKEVVSVEIRRALAVEFVAVGLPIDGFWKGEPPPDRPSHILPEEGLSDAHAIALVPGTSGSDAEKGSVQASWTGAPDAVSAGEGLSDAPSDVLSAAPGGEGHESPVRDPDIRAEAGESAESDNSAVDSAFSQVDSLSGKPGRAVPQNPPFARDVVTQGLVVGVHNPHSSSRIPQSPPRADRKACRIVAKSTDADDDETRFIVDHIRRTHKPRNLVGYLRAMARNDDLADVLADIRDQRRHADESAERRRQIETLHAESPPIDPPVTPEEGVAARAAIRGLLAGIGRPSKGQPTPIGDLLGRARSA